MNDTSHFILRYYYFLEDEIEPLEQLAEIVSQNAQTISGNNPPAQLIDQSASYYKLNYPQGKMIILAVKTSVQDDYWATAMNQLQSWEEQAQLCADDFMGRLTILVGYPDPWEGLLKNACALLSCEVPGIIGLEKGKLACLSVDHKRGETVYLCGLDDVESVSAVFLFQRMPLLQGSIIRLQKLDTFLHDRHLAIRREKEEMERDLIKILHAKLVMSQASLMAAEELEGEIEGLATAYGKLVGDQNMVVDGVKRLEAALLTVERQSTGEPALLLSSLLFKQLTESYQQHLEDLRNTREELNLVRGNYQAAIDVVQSKIEVMNSRTNIATQEQIKGLLEVNIAMQKQSLVFQYAAGLIEFVVLAYYSHTLWSHLQHTAYTVIPSWIQFVVVLLFSGNTVWVTHLLAEYKQGEIHVQKELILASMLLLLIFVVVVAGSIMAGSHAAGH